MSNHLWRTARPFSFALSRCSTCSKPRQLRPCPDSSRRTFITLPDLSKLAPTQRSGGGGGSRPSDAQTFHEQKDFRYSPEELYDIVADVGSYSQFLPNCLDSRVLGPADPPHPTLVPRTVRFSDQDSAALRRSGTAVRTDLTVGFKAFKESYTSRVEMFPGRVVTATADTSTNLLFKHLYTEWSFHPIASSSSIPLSLFGSSASSSSKASESEPVANQQSSSTRLEFTLEYAFRNPLYGMVASQAFDIMARRMMHAFEEPAINLYGRQ